MTLFDRIDLAIAGQGPHRNALTQVIAGCPPELTGIGAATRNLGDHVQAMARALGELELINPALAEPGHDVHASRGMVGRDQK